MYMVYADFEELTMQNELVSLKQDGINNILYTRWVIILWTNFFDCAISKDEYFKMNEWNEINKCTESPEKTKELGKLKTEW